MLKNKKACFALLARNCRNALAQNLLRIERFSLIFKEIFIVIVENDSTDGTKEFLCEMQKCKQNFFIITCDSENNSSFMKKAGGIERIEKMAFYRNQYLNFIKNFDFYETIDYLIVIDSDIKYFSEQGVISALENAPTDWTALFANGRYYFDLLNITILGRYYDLFAFVPHKDCGVSNLNTNLTYREMALCADLLTNRKLKKVRYMKCLSAFGGIGIYKIKAIRDGKYDTRVNERSNVFDAVCEHVNLNLTCTLHGNNYISADMLVCYEKSLRSILSKIVPIKLKIFIYETLTNKTFPH